MTTPKDFPRIIGFTGSAGAGKTTSARIILGTYPDFHKLSLADPIREMLAVLGLVPADFDQEHKESPCDKLCGKTPRHAMQTLGTEWGRDKIGSTIWLDAAMRRADALVFNGLRVVIDDIRFDNEAQAVVDRGGVVIRVARPGNAVALATAAHQSERGVSDELVGFTVSAPDYHDLRTQLYSIFNQYTPY